MNAGGLFLLSNGSRRLETIHVGHLKIHQDDVESERRECLQDLFTIACNSDLMPPKLQKFDGDLLVDFIVFRK